MGEIKDLIWTRFWLLGWPTIFGKEIKTGFEKSPGIGLYLEGFN